jgi:Methylase involved in ubiquinone/menaquinone biosynthesis
MFNWDTRYANLLNEWREDLETGSVLEVGCGPQGIARYLKNNVTGLELQKIQPAVSNLQIIEGSITAIPFPDDSFDYVVCSDVLEHLPAETRLTAISEIIRVARKSVLSRVLTATFLSKLKRCLLTHLGVWECSYHNGWKNTWRTAYQNSVKPLRVSWMPGLFRTSEKMRE